MRCARFGLVLVALAFGCDGEEDPPDSGGGEVDASSSSVDAGAERDASERSPDGGDPMDGGSSIDAGAPDGGSSEDGGGASDGGPVDAGPMDAGDPCLRCVSDTVRWGTEDIVQGILSQSTVLDCRSYDRMDDFPEFYQCSGTVSCTDGTTIADLLDALAHPDVQSLLTRSRMADAPVNLGFVGESADFFIQVGTAKIVVGTPCFGSGDGGCEPIPPAIETLRSVMENLTIDDRMCLS